MFYKINIYYNDGSVRNVITAESKESIYERFRSENEFVWKTKIGSQVNKIEFTNTFIPGCSSLKYLFIDYEGNGLLQ